MASTGDVTCKSNVQKCFCHIKLFIVYSNILISTKHFLILLKILQDCLFMCKINLLRFFLNKLWKLDKVECLISRRPTERGVTSFDFLNTSLMEPHNNIISYFYFFVTFCEVGQFAFIIYLSRLIYMFMNYIILSTFS